MRPIVVSLLVLLVLVVVVVPALAQSDALAECDDPDTEVIEYCCPDLTAKSCSPCDDPTTAIDECAGGVEGNDGDQLGECTVGIICHGNPKTLDLFFADPTNVVVASGIQYIPLPAADRKVATVPVEVTVVATESCVVPPDRGPLYMVTISPVNKKGPAIVLFALKQRFEGKVHRTISETTFITATDSALMFTYKEADGTLRTMVFSPRPAQAQRRLRREHAVGGVPRPALRTVGESRSRADRRVRN